MNAEEKKILIIEDDESIALMEKDYLEVAGLVCEICNDGILGLQRALEGDFSLVVVDVMLPGLSGFEVCRYIREKKDIPLIIVSALADDLNKVRGLGLGVDDYMTKPFSPGELVARVQGHIRRYEQLTKGKNQEKEDVLRIRGLEIDRKQERVFLNGEEKAMTGTEFSILLLLAQNPGRVFSREELFDRIWGMESMGDTSNVTVHIKHVRDKIEKEPRQAEYIETVWGKGYRFKP